MTNIKKGTLLLVLIASTHLQLLAQPFISEINNFRRADSLHAPPDQPILFIGSSSFTNWKDVGQYFPTHTILNRGFGGSSLPHLILYANEVVFKYNPKQIVIYCGENDLTGGPLITADTILNRYKQLHQLIRSKFPTVPIAYISMKPSPSRATLLPLMEKGNQLIKRYLRKQKASAYINVYNSMFTPEGAIMPDIFLKDNLHMNKKGYDIWQKIIAPYLVN